MSKSDALVLLSIIGLFIVLIPTAMTREKVDPWQPALYKIGFWLGCFCVTVIMIVTMPLWIPFLFGWGIWHGLSQINWPDLTKGFKDAF